MKSVHFFLLLGAASALSTKHRYTVPQSVFAEQDIRNDDEHAQWNIPTVHESLIQARRILHLSSLGTLVTTFPDDRSDSDVGAFENRPANMGGVPIGLVEYYADCADENGNYGNPTILALSVATPFKNYRQGSNISLSLRWWPDQKHVYSPAELPTPHTPVGLPRFSLVGHLEQIDFESMAGRTAQACFLSKHPDSIYWQPGNRIHTATYVRFVVDYIYWLGGFGDRARIGWLPVDEWRNITMDEVNSIRLPGEKSEKSWIQWISGM